MARPSTRPIALAAIKDKPGTQGELQARTGLSSGSICRHVHALHAEGAVHIARWRRAYADTGAPFMAVYKFGPGKDAPKPTPFTVQETSARYRERQRKSGAWEDKKAQHRAYHWRKKAPQRDPLAQALYGPA